MYDSPASNVNAANALGYTLKGAYDPSVNATAAPKGAIFLKTSSPVGEFQKLDDGLSTNWVPFSSGSGGTQSFGTLAAPIAVDAATGVQLDLTSQSNADVYVTGDGAPQILADPPLTVMGVFVGMIVTIIGGQGSDVDTVDFQDTGTAGDFYCNGDTTIGYKQVLQMKCVNVIDSAAGTADWVVISKQP